jgi:hypothetical protein
MSTFLAVFVVMLLIVAAMAVGVMFGRQPIKGSCGGMAAVGMEAECDVCGGDKVKCDTEVKSARKAARQQALADLGIDATGK